ncbi:hypothetical protein, partial [Yoonia sp.]|uniref:hypothetical protein n=1 Tax=Yoonia sp. TaxID=2212373 RepID=UPI00238D41C0
TLFLAAPLLSAFLLGCDGGDDAEHKRQYLIAKACILTQIKTPASQTLRATNGREAAVCLPSS